MVPEILNNVPLLGGNSPYGLSQGVSSGICCWKEDASRVKIDPTSMHLELAGPGTRFIPCLPFLCRGRVLNNSSVKEVQLLSCQFELINNIFCFIL